MVSEKIKTDMLNYNLLKIPKNEMAFLVSASNRENIKLHKLTNPIEQNCTYNNKQVGNFSQSHVFLVGHWK